MRALTRIQGSLDRFSAAEAKVASAILADPRIVVDNPITRMAELCGTSAATVARFCQGLGYSGYREFRFDLVGTTSRDQADLDRSNISTGDIDPADTVADVAAKVLFQETQAIEHTLRELDLAAVDRARDALAEAPDVVVAGFGSSGLTAHDLNMKLQRIGRRSSHHADVHLALSSTALLRPGGVFIGISHSGVTPEILGLLKEARHTGATTVGLTNDAGSPLAELCDILLTTHVREHAFRSGATASRTAQLAVTDVLFVRLAQSLFDTMNDSLSRTREAVIRHRADQEVSRRGRSAS
ncbi:MurR/RpiR family transcriptional regulator [Arthrobacter gandavensis]|uniref:MurR/RpiR family transcriptional regulator n=1 Tax=Arthrobacter gandavensis TaxID=169960 RepID=UPI0018901716|nr:MurR/RpiR family transcriptional regulator [Arthrobacter gandavensis]MBF4992914.1 MurR/RpiR family transcriptional regulator [Arthrobacter gandavensis]